MGITISCKGSNNSLDMSYGSFFNLRCVIAKNINEALYEHYKTILKQRTQAEREEWDNTANSIIQAQKLDKTKSDCMLLDFLFQPDAGGSISYGTAKRILGLVQEEPDTDIYGYAGWEHPSTMGDFKKLLQDAYASKKPIKWS